MASLNRNAIPIDWHQLDALCDGDEAFTLELLNLYTADTASQLPRLRAAIASADASALAQIAHYLKGASANIGATVLQSLAKQLETNGREGNLSGASSTYERFVEQFEQLRQAVPTA